MKKEGLLATFEKLSYTHRKEYCRWIAEAKKEETRSSRIAKAIEMLREGIKTPGKCDRIRYASANLTPRPAFARLKVAAMFGEDR
jgi:hypothetical protein